ncbi:hypothetical protein [Mycolicibacterium setense]|uniref:hypothetical protein n=1 Tax=Mycolicibacterium setense TaxID=431269 RepID=UPI0014707ECC|nr:hypothetical protein [Mycolicibacterium setense]
MELSRPLWAWGWARPAEAWVRDPTALGRQPERRPPGPRRPGLNRRPASQLPALRAPLAPSVQSALLPPQPGR